MRFFANTQVAAMAEPRTYPFTHPLFDLAVERVVLHETDEDAPFTQDDYVVASTCTVARSLFIGRDRAVLDQAAWSWLCPYLRRSQFAPLFVGPNALPNEHTEAKFSDCAFAAKSAFMLRAFPQSSQINPPLSVSDFENLRLTLCFIYGVSLADPGAAAINEECRRMPYACMLLTEMSPDQAHAVELFCWVVATFLFVQRELPGVSKTANVQCALRKHHVFDLFFTSRHLQHKPPHADIAAESYSVWLDKSVYTNIDVIQPDALRNSLQRSVSGDFVPSPLSTVDPVQMTVRVPTFVDEDSVPPEMRAYEARAAMAYSAVVDDYNQCLSNTVLAFADDPLTLSHVYAVLYEGCCPLTDVRAVNFASAVVDSFEYARNFYSDGLRHTAHIMCVRTVLDKLGQSKQWNLENVCPLTVAPYEGFVETVHAALFNRAAIWKQLSNVRFLVDVLDLARKRMSCVPTGAELCNDVEAGRFDPFMLYRDASLHVARALVCLVTAGGRKYGTVDGDDEPANTSIQNVGQRVSKVVLRAALMFERAYGHADNVQRRATMAMHRQEKAMPWMVMLYTRMGLFSSLARDVEAPVVRRKATEARDMPRAQHTTEQQFLNRYATAAAGADANVARKREAVADMEFLFAYVPCIRYLMSARQDVMDALVRLRVIEASATSSEALNRYVNAREYQFSKYAAEKFFVDGTPEKELFGLIAGNTAYALTAASKYGHLLTVTCVICAFVVGKHKMLRDFVREYLDMVGNVRLREGSEHSARVAALHSENARSVFKAASNPITYTVVMAELLANISDVLVKKIPMRNVLDQDLDFTSAPAERARATRVAFGLPPQMVVDEFADE